MWQLRVLTTGKAKYEVETRGITGNIKFAWEPSTQIKGIRIRKKAAASRAQPLYQDPGAAASHAGTLYQTFHHYYSSQKTEEWFDLK